MNVDFHNNLPNKENSVLIVGAYANGNLLSSAELSKPMLSIIEKAIKTKRFKGTPKSLIELIAPDGEMYSRLIIVGLGDENKNTKYDLECIGGSLTPILEKGEESTAVALFKGLKAEDVALITNALLLKSWHFDKYFTTEKNKPKRNFNTLHVACDDTASTQAMYTTLSSVSEGAFLTREVISEVPNILYPETFCQKAKELTSLGVEVEILGENEMKELGMHSLLAVGQGSEKESKLCVLKWNGGKSTDAPIAFVGKGVTFDTGGISIKPSNNMHEMKYDMGGAGVVLGLMKALALRKANANVICVAGLAENMPSGSAQRPGDVWVSMSGQTIECLNTDAEGRMVLADALWYTQDRFKPQIMINLATLTGAIVVALGEEHAGLFSNNDKLAERLYTSGQEVGEKVWRMPMGDAYDKAINSTVADMKNIGNPGTGGSITAAQFLQRFVNNTPWAHLDIAGVTWANKGRDLCAPGASGFGVRLLNNLIQNHYESSK